MKEKCKSFRREVTTAGENLDTKALTVDMLNNIETFPSVNERIYEMDEKKYDGLEFVLPLQKNIEDQIFQLKPGYLAKIKDRKMRSKIDNHKIQLSKALEQLNLKKNAMIEIAGDHLKHWQLSEFVSIKSEIKTFDSAYDSKTFNILKGALAAELKLFLLLEDLTELSIGLKLHHEEVSKFEKILTENAAVHDKREMLKKKMTELLDLQNDIISLDERDPKSVKKFNELSVIIKEEVEIFNKVEIFKNAVNHAECLESSNKLLRSKGTKCTNEAMLSIKEWHKKNFKAIKIQIEECDVDKNLKEVEELQERLNHPFLLIIEIEKTGFGKFERLLALKTEMMKMIDTLSNKAGQNVKNPQSE